jgi:hypothetical protein
VAAKEEAAAAAAGFSLFGDDEDADAGADADAGGAGAPEKAVERAMERRRTAARASVAQGVGLPALQLQLQECQTQAALGGGPQPVWDPVEHASHFTLPLAEGDVLLKMEVWAVQTVADELLGTATVDVQQCRKRCRKRKWYPLDTGGDLQATLRCTSPPLAPSRRLPLARPRPLSLRPSRPPSLSVPAAPRCTGRGEG